MISPPRRVNHAFSTKSKADQLWHHDATLEAHPADGYRRGHLLDEVGRLVGGVKALAG